MNVFIGNYPNQMQTTATRIDTLVQLVSVIVISYVNSILIFIFDIYYR